MPRDVVVGAIQIELLAKNVKSEGNPEDQTLQSACPISQILHPKGLDIQINNQNHCNPIKIRYNSPINKSPIKHKIVKRKRTIPSLEQNTHNYLYPKTLP